MIQCTLTVNFNQADSEWKKIRTKKNQKTVEITLIILLITLLLLLRNMLFTSVTKAVYACRSVASRSNYH